jgi:hypothetical protein
VSKHVIRIPPLRAGRRVSWTFEVSAADAVENGARTHKALKKRQKARLIMAKRTPSAPAETDAPMTASPVETAAPPAGVRAAKPASRRMLQAVDSGPIVVAAVAILLIAVLAYPGRSSTPNAEEHDTVSPAVVAESSAVAPHMSSAPAKKAARVNKGRVAESSKPAAAAAVRPVANITVKENAATKSPEPEATAPVAHTAVATVAGLSPVTITGCLETSVDHDEFRLTDTDGVDAPKSRSWRTGFVKKTAAPVALVDAPSRLALGTHVGHRVTATGVLTNHDLRVSALRFVGPLCN